MGNGRSDDDTLIGIMPKLMTARNRGLESPHHLPSVEMKLNRTR